MISPRAGELRLRLENFMAEHVYPNERLHFEQAEAAGPFGHAVVTDEIKPRARAAGVWYLGGRRRLPIAGARRYEARLGAGERLIAAERIESREERTRTDSLWARSTNCSKRRTASSTFPLSTTSASSRRPSTSPAAGPVAR